MNQLFTIVSLLAPLFIAPLFIAPTAFAMEKEFFVKTGYMAWDEKLASATNFVSEKGLTIEPGIRVILGDMITLEGAVSLKNTVTYSDAVTVDLNDRIRGIRDHIGGKLELKGAGNFPLGPLTLGPVIGTSGEIFYRIGPQELWKVVDGKAGARISFPLAGLRTRIEAGAVRSLFIENDWNSSFKGNPHFVLRPRAMTNPYAEITVTRGKHSLGIYYETHDMGASPSVPAQGGSSSGAVIFQGSALQPDTSITAVGLSWSVRF